MAASVKKTIFTLTVLFLVVLSFFPLYWLFVSSLKPADQLFDMPPKWYTLTPTLKHYIAAFKTQPLGLYYRNSTIVAVITLLISLVFGCMIAYPVARLKFRGKSVVLMLVAATSMFPAMTMVLPIFTALRDIGLLNSYVGLGLTHAAFSLPMVVWLLSALFKEVPAELEDAALIDGYNRLQAFLNIMLPLAAPAMATAAILVFVNSWNEFLFSFTMMSEAAKRTLPVGIMMFPGEFEFPWATISAAIVVSVVPLVLVILLFQKQVVQGLTNGAVKG
ncbi:carbohydrate ABC transporter permease [Paenibacillus thalictri]|uniref:Carbohydrate ABC transporter permease n=1 Tax=Paenibacillus thalictri TaxID=2527873 RepID=A0A4Q9DHP9_9BACL|nr:carbohydrate ABC transporter permease [Paenibacillus thalictri]TBL72486.1 carbohydrate ABC transporter permease [Paenibacillus thalictri]